MVRIQESHTFAPLIIDLPFLRLRNGHIGSRRPESVTRSSSRRNLLSPMESPAGS